MAYLFLVGLQRGNQSSDSNRILVPFNTSLIIIFRNKKIIFVIFFIYNYLDLFKWFSCSFYFYLGYHTYSSTLIMKYGLMLCLEAFESNAPEEVTLHFAIIPLSAFSKRVILNHVPNFPAISR